MWWISKCLTLKFNKHARPHPVTIWVNRSQTPSIWRYYNKSATILPSSPTTECMLSSKPARIPSNTPFSQRPLPEFENQDDRLGAYLQSLGDKLNSNESFDADAPLHTELTIIRTPAPGSGNGKRYRPASAAVRKMSKQSIITIRNDDDLCCAQAIVTMKAWADQHCGDREAYHDYNNLRKGQPIQTRRVREFHQLAGVPEGPCGLEEVAKFQAVLPDYQIKVMTIDPPYDIIYKGPHASDKLILLVTTDRHSDGCNSFAGFLSKSYFCHDCDKGYDKDTFQAHPCDGKRCAACKTKDCKGYLAAKETARRPRPTVPCHLRKRSFYGDDCLANHYLSTNKPSLCLTLKKCTLCCKEYEAGKKSSQTQMRMGSLSLLHFGCEDRLPPMLYPTRIADV